MLIQKGLIVIEVWNGEKFIDVNIEKVTQDNEHIILRATADGEPENISQTIDGITYKAINVGYKIYVPDKEVK